MTLVKAPIPITFRILKSSIEIFLFLSIRFSDLLNLSSESFFLILKYSYNSFIESILAPSKGILLIFFFIKASVVTIFAKLISLTMKNLNFEKIFFIFKIVFTRHTIISFLNVEC